jgi:hypothetical protein
LFRLGIPSQTTGWQVQVAAEEAAHVRLVAEAAGKRNLGQGHLICQHHVAGALDAVAADEGGG